MLVDAQVLSMKPRRPGSSSAWPSNQSYRRSVKKAPGAATSRAFSRLRQPHYLEAISRSLSTTARV
jgi:hypothetical protein